MKPTHKQAGASFLYKVGAVLIAAAITIAVKRGWLPGPSSAPSGPSGTSTSSLPPDSRGQNATGTVCELFHSRRSDVWVETTGRVEKLLPDDTDTSDNSDKHQKFLLLVPGDITVLVAHNISTAPRVPVRQGDNITLRGEYEFTEKGGTIHFTHKPKFNSRNAKSGWIEFKGAKYE